MCLTCVKYTEEFPPPNPIFFSCPSGKRFEMSWGKGLVSPWIDSRIQWMLYGESWWNFSEKFLPEKRLLTAGEVWQLPSPPSPYSPVHYRPGACSASTDLTTSVFRLAEQKELEMRSRGPHYPGGATCQDLHTSAANVGIFPNPFRCKFRPGPGIGGVDGI